MLVEEACVGSCYRVACQAHRCAWCDWSSQGTADDVAHFDDMLKGGDNKFDKFDKVSPAVPLLQAHFRAVALCRSLNM